VLLIPWTLRSGSEQGGFRFLQQDKASVETKIFVFASSQNLCKIYFRFLQKFANEN
jgi:hypothetical protein